ncbi:MAG: TrkA family potassium uptake protein [Bacteroidales bacterium]|nr:TrkA family potassium uptake protein [Bacteroidales bacterium]MDD3871623.1 TrkA family potassium uptake protein [Bacteroidales bacterium]MDD4812405.1 TrkA family potassium uptake protein [Bacteroidales bacterium]
MTGKKIAVIGLGQFGRAICTALTNSGAEVLAIDAREEVVDSFADKVTSAVALDATDKKALLKVNITDMDAVVVAIGQDMEQLLLCTVLLLELKVKRVIARATGKRARLILEKIGAHEVLSPEEEFGQIVAERLTNPNLVSYLQLPDNYRIAEITPPRQIIGRTIGNISLREKYRLSLITVKSIHDEGSHIEGVVDYEFRIENFHTLVVFGLNRDLDRFVTINE